MKQRSILIRNGPYCADMSVCVMEIQLIDMLGETFLVVFFLGASYIYSICP